MIENILTVIGSVFGPATRLLALCRRYELPVIVARIRQETPESNASSYYARLITLWQPTNPSTWLVRDVKISQPRDRKWLAKNGEPHWNEYGEFVGYSMIGGWASKISFDQPMGKAEVLLHVDAPAVVELSLTIVLRSRRRVRRRIDAITE